MKKFNMNNSVKVKLSSIGAEIKNKINSDTNKLFKDKKIKNIKKLKVDYVEGDIYENQLWIIMNEFEGPEFIRSYWSVVVDKDDNVLLEIFTKRMGFNCFEYQARVVGE